MASKRITGYLNTVKNSKEIEYIQGERKQTEAVTNLIELGFILENMGLGKLITGLKFAGYDDKKALIAALKLLEHDSDCQVRKPESKEVNQTSSKSLSPSVKTPSWDS